MYIFCSLFLKMVVVQQLRLLCEGNYSQLQGLKTDGNSFFNNYVIYSI